MGNTSFSEELDDVNGVKRARYSSRVTQKVDAHYLRVGREYDRVTRKIKTEIDVYEYGVREIDVAFYTKFCYPDPNDPKCTLQLMYRTPFTNEFHRNGSITNRLDHEKLITIKKEKELYWYYTQFKNEGSFQPGIWYAVVLYGEKNQYEVCRRYFVVKDQRRMYFSTFKGGKNQLKFLREKTNAVYFKWESKALINAKYQVIVRLMEKTKNFKGATQYRDGQECFSTASSNLLEFDVLNLTFDVRRYPFGEFQVEVYVTDPIDCHKSLKILDRHRFELVGDDEEDSIQTSTPPIVGTGVPFFQLTNNIQKPPPITTPEESQPLNSEKPATNMANETEKKETDGTSQEILGEDPDTINISKDTDDPGLMVPESELPLPQPSSSIDVVEEAQGIPDSDSGVLDEGVEPNVSNGGEASDKIEQLQKLSDHDDNSGGKDHGGDDQGTMKPVANTNEEKDDVDVHDDDVDCKSCHDYIAFADEQDTESKKKFATIPCGHSFRYTDVRYCEKCLNDWVSGGIYVCPKCGVKVSSVLQLKE